MAESTKRELNRPLAAASSGQKVLLFYEKERSNGKEFRLATSTDGTSFKASRKKIQLGDKMRETDSRGTRNFRLNEVGGKSVISFEQNVAGKKSTIFFVATDQTSFVEASAIEAPGTAVVVPDFHHGGKHAVYFRTPVISASYTKDFKTWQHTKALLLEQRSGFFDSSALTVIGSLKVDGGILILYESSRLEDGMH